MKPGQIVRLLPLAPPVVSAGAESAAFPAANLVSPQPKVVCRVPDNTTGSTAYFAVDFDLGSDQSFDTVGLLYHTVASYAVSWAVAATTEAQGPGALDSGNFVVAETQLLASLPTIATARYHSVRSFDAVARRYVRFVVVMPPGAGFTIGVAVVGQTIPLDPQFNFDLGSGRKVEDLSDIRKLPDGGFGVWRKAVAPMFRATWSQLTDAQMMIDLWAALREIGTSAPLLLIEDPDQTAGWQERVHYGLIDSLDYYGRQQVDKSSIELKVRDWL